MVGDTQPAFCGRIILIDDHPLVLSGIADMLRVSGYFVTTARNVSEARNLIDSDAQFDLALLDLNLGSESGLELLNSVPVNLPERIIMLSGVIEQEMVLQGFQMGAFGFIPKTIDLDKIVAVISAMMIRPKLNNSGWMWSAELNDIVEARMVMPPNSTLTNKEREVFMLMREGKLDKQVADELGISIHTVRVHLRAIKRKRGHNRRSELSY
jgi:two-component system nitrate/nitrite response regulator NarL